MDDARIRRILRQHVETDRLLGVDSVPVADAVSVPPQAAGDQASEVSASEEAPDVRAMGPTDAGASLFGEPAAPVAPVAAAPLPPPVARTTGEAAGGEGLPPVPRYGELLSAEAKRHILHNIDVNEVRACRKCTLCETRTQTVFGEGDVDAKLLFIGEGPGEQEDLQGRPFVGRAGQKLNEMIGAMGLKREQVFIANVVKCRPPGNRPPQPQEIDACWDYLRRQIETIQPRVIVTLGGPATKTLLATVKGITTIRGIWHQFNGLRPAGPAIPVMPTFHPSYLLRAYTPENRKKVWSDLQAVMRLLATGA